MNISAFSKLTASLTTVWALALIPGIAPAQVTGRVLIGNGLSAGSISVSIDGTAPVLLASGELLDFDAGPFLRDVIVEATLPGLATPLNATVQTSSLDSASITAHLNASGLPVLSSFTEATATGAFDSGALVLRNLAGAQTLNLEVRDVTLDSVVAQANSVANGSDVRFPLPFGDYFVEARSPSGAVVLPPQTVTVRPAVTSVVSLFEVSPTSAQALTGEIGTFPVWPYSVGCENLNSSVSFSGDGSTTSFSIVTEGVPTGSVGVLLVGFEATRQSLFGLGAPNCSLAVDANVVVPLATTDIAVFTQTLPQAVLEIAPPSYWQIAYTGVASPAGVGLTAAVQIRF